MERQIETLLLELKDKKNEPLLAKCAGMMEEMQEELERNSRIMQQQKKLIQILKEGKEYYQAEYKSNSFEHELAKMQQQNQHLNTLLASHRKANQELKHHLQKMHQEIGYLNAKRKEQQRAVRQSEDRYRTVTLQKQILEKQWNKVVKAVKRKIVRIVNHNNPEQSRIDTRQKSLKKTAEKENQDPDCGYQQPGLKDNNLQGRAGHMIQFINDKLAIQELQDLFNAKTSAKKTNEGITREIFKSLDQNHLRTPFAGFD